jgi:hypothetical protein
MKGPVRELLPVGEQRVRLRLPVDRTPSGVRLLVAVETPAFRVSSGWLELVVPSILAHEVVAVGLHGGEGGPAGRASSPPVR